MLGGVGQSIDLKTFNTDEEKHSELFDQLIDAFENGSQMTASISVGLLRATSGAPAAYLIHCVFTRIHFI